MKIYILKSKNEKIIFFAHWKYNKVIIFLIKNSNSFSIFRTNSNKMLKKSEFDGFSFTLMLEGRYEGRFGDFEVLQESRVTDTSRIITKNLWKINVSDQEFFQRMSDHHQRTSTKQSVNYQSEANFEKLTLFFKHNFFGFLGFAIQRIFRFREISGFSEISPTSRKA